MCWAGPPLLVRLDDLNQNDQHGTTEDVVPVSAPTAPSTYSTSSQPGPDPRLNYQALIVLTGTLKTPLRRLLPPHHPHLMLLTLSPIEAIPPPIIPCPDKDHCQEGPLAEGSLSLEKMDTVRELSEDINPASPCFHRGKQCLCGQEMPPEVPSCKACL